MRSRRVAEAIAALDRPRSCLWRLELVKHWALMRDDGRAIRRRLGLATGLRAAFALGAAAAILLRDVWRYRGEGDADGLASAKTIAAIHPELTNRTRHLLRLIPSDGSVPVLLLGRPRVSRTAAAALFAGEAPAFAAPLVRALSPRALRRAVPGLLRAMASGARVLASAPHPPSTGEMVAIGYRILLGEVHAAWWREQPHRPEVIVFAHTGVGDTSRLERAAQRSGASTVHVAHGISNGYSFDGISDLFVAACRHDAEMHQALGNYRAATWAAAPAPSAQVERQHGSILLTNFAHPANTVYLEHGITAEERIIDIAAAGLDTGVRFYRPHPALETLPVEEQKAAREQAAKRGFSAWPVEWPYADVASWTTVLTTPSTALFDLMRVGRAPILLGAEEADELTCYTRYPVSATDGAGVAAWRSGTAMEADWLVDAWERIGPARSLTDWADLCSLIEATLGQIER